MPFLLFLRSRRKKCLSSKSANTEGAGYKNIKILPKNEICLRLYFYWWHKCCCFCHNSLAFVQVKWRSAYWWVKGRLGSIGFWVWLYAGRIFGWKVVWLFGCQENSLYWNVHFSDYLFIEYIGVIDWCVSIFMFRCLFMGLFDLLCLSQWNGFVF